MSRSKFEKTFNTFTKGLITEASELNFPEDSSLYEKNFVLYRDGGRDRRRGMELVYPLGLTLTSTLYPLEFDDELASTPLAPSVSWITPPSDWMGVAVSPPQIKIESTVRYTGYGNWPPEVISTIPLAPEIELVTVVIEVPENREARFGPDLLGVGVLEPHVQIETTVGYVNYSIPFEELAVEPLPPAIEVITI